MDPDLDVGQPSGVPMSDPTQPFGFRFFGSG